MVYSSNTVLVMARFVSIRSWQISEIRTFLSSWEWWMPLCLLKFDHVNWIGLVKAEVDRKEISNIVFRPNFFQIGRLFGLMQQERLRKRLLRAQAFKNPWNFKFVWATPSFNVSNNCILLSQQFLTRTAIGPWPVDRSCFGRPWPWSHVRCRHQSKWYHKANSWLS